MNQKGFTLIEIIAVLVILAILAVVAVPKYMSMISDSKNKAAIGGVAEGMGRVNMLVAKYMLSNNGAPPLATAIAADTTLGSTSGDFPAHFHCGRYNRCSGVRFSHHGECTGWHRNRGCRDADNLRPKARNICP